MYLYRVALIALTGVISAAPMVAQGIPRNARTQTVNVAPRLMVANPFAFAATDSANAVRIGSAVRDEMKGIVGRNFNVVEQAQMNDALKQYGYPVDAILSPPLATTLAKNIQARVLVSSTLSRSRSRADSVTARLVGVNDEAGYVVALTRREGQGAADFGKRIAQALAPAVKALPDAKACIDQRTSKPDKAAEAANKAIRTVPNHGLAHLCLAQLATDRKAPRSEVVKHLEAAVKGDPLSLPAWTALATQHQAANDTAATLIAFKQMLRVAPTNQKLREELFKYFLQSGHPETARDVADEGLKLDPYNADLYDLKSNACLFLSDFKCAIDALETMYATDSTKADTLFFTKISAAAAEGEKPDTVRLLKWSQIGVRKYPDNPTLLSYLNRAYSMSGPVDSVIAVTNRIISKDTTAVVPALEAARALIDAKRPKEAVPFLEFAIKHGDAQAKENAAALFYTGGAPLLQEPQDLQGAEQLLRMSVAAANPAGKVYPAANYMLGLATLFQVPQIDPLAEKQKSCDLAKQEQGLLAAADSALTLGRSVNPEAADKNLGIIKKYQPRVASMLKVYCKGR